MKKIMKITKENKIYSFGYRSNGYMVLYVHIVINLVSI